MASWNPRANEIFANALELVAPEERRAYLDQACGADEALRRQVDALLAAHAQAGNFLERAPATPAETLTFQPAEKSGVSTAAYTGTAEAVGTIIAGRYKLLQQIGEGGMGTVYLAEQTQPVKRMVAAKIIKPGMDSKTVLACFEAERQALALMDHPHIAKVLEAGTTERGHPFFVMELVKGIPLTKFCDEKQLAIGARLKIFQQVCHAVQHSHQKGIIHRDLKPSNILVESHDGQPVPKVIDFGLAKAMNALPLTERSLFTGFGSVLGTPLYMAPEQAEFNALDVDTRADIYALGVILYELLTGSTPLEKKRFAEAAWEEIRRVLKEEDPPKPSARLSSSEALPSIAAQRQTEPHKLGKFVCGDLDWIVMKALAKERDRRYDTANAFAADVERFLNHEPVSAGPPSARYRLGKFVKRNRGRVVAGGVVLLALVVGIIGTTLGLIEAKRQEGLAVAAQRQETARAEAEYKQRQRAEAAEAEAKTQQAEALAQKKQAETNAAEATKQEKEAKDKLALATAVTEFLQTDLLGQAGSKAQADRKFEPDPDLTITDALDRAAAAVGDKFQDRPELEASIRQTVGDAYRDVGQYAKAILQLRQSADIRKGKLGPDHPDTLITLNNLAGAYQAAGKTTAAIALLKQVHGAQVKKLGPDHPDTLNTLSNLGGMYADAGKTTEAIALLKQVREARMEQLGADHPDTLYTLNNLALAYQDAGNTTTAIALLERVREAFVKKLGPDHPDTLNTLNNLADVYGAAGKTAAAIALLEQVREAFVKKLGPGHPHTLATLNNLAAAYRDAGKTTQAIALFGQVRDASMKKLGPEHPHTLATLNNLAGAYQDAGKTTEAIALFEQIRDAQVKKLGPDHPGTLITLNNLAGAYLAAARTTEAIALFEKVRDTRVKKLGLEHPHTLATLNNLATAYQAAGKATAAIALLEKVRDIKVRKLGPDHPDTLTTLNNLASAYRESGNLNQAELLYRYSLPISRDKLGDDHPATLLLANGLGTTLQLLGRHADAEPLLRDTLARRRRALGEHHPRTLLTQRLLASTYVALGKHDIAEPLLKGLADFSRTQTGPDSPVYAGQQVEYGQSLLAQKKYQDAESILRECLAIREKKEPAAWTTFNTKSLLGEALVGQKKYADAEPLLLAGYEGMKQCEAKIPPQGKVRLTEALERLVKLYESWGKTDKAAEWRKKCEVAKTGQGETRK